MSDRQTLAILFYLRRDKKKSETEIPIYMRITLNGKRAEMAIHRYIDPEHWNNSAGVPRGTKNEIKNLQEFLNLQRSKVYQAQKDLIDNGKVVTAIAIRNIVQGKTEKQHTLLEVFDYHNKLMEEKVPAEYAPTTLVRFTTTRKHVSDFLQYQYKVDDMFLSQLNHEFVSSLEHYFKTVKACNHNSTIKYIKNLKKVVNLAVKNDWLNRDPFISFKATIKPVNRAFLTADELESIEKKKIEIQRIAQVRDIFVFSCYTGLAYVDAFKLSRDNLVTGIDGEKWILTNRKKTGSKSNVPLLPKALEIIDKYKNDPECIHENKLLPVLSNQKMNAYLKEVATIVGIKKTLTFHLARHTFATTITLTNGVPIESVSEMLGHKSIRTTQIYAKVIDKKVSQDMNELRNKLLGSTIRKQKLVKKRNAGNY
ncbi:MAG TPA: site-specific integrase [Bacteroidales bacterium]|nr:site-specific integrase [Bacteroidales bacterium]